MRKLIRNGLLTGVAAIACSLTTACNVFPENDDSQQQQVARENEKLQNIYNGVVGRYEGRVQVGSETLDANMFLYTQPVRVNDDPSGRPVSRIRLLAQIKFNQIGIFDDQIFLVDYREFSGEFSMGQDSAVSSSTTCPVGPRDPKLAVVDGRLVGGAMSGSLLGTNGVLGRLDMTKMTSDSAPPVGDQRARLLDAYGRAQGLYGGHFSSSGKELSFQMTLNVAEVKVGDFLICPALRGQYLRADFRPDYTEIGAMTLQGTYYPGTRALQVYSVTQETAKDQPGAKTLSMSTELNEATGDMSGLMHWYLYDGSVEIERCETAYAGPGTLAVDKNGKCCPKGTNVRDDSNTCKRIKK